MVGLELIERWVDGVETPRQDIYGGRDLFYLALDRGVTDPRVIQNAVALNEYALFLYNRYQGSVSYDSIVEGLLRGVDYPCEPYWWYARCYYRFKAWLGRFKRGKVAHRG